MSNQFYLVPWRHLTFYRLNKQLRIAQSTVPPNYVSIKHIVLLCGSLSLLDKNVYALKKVICQETGEGRNYAQALKPSKKETKSDEKFRQFQFKIFKKN